MKEKREANKEVKFRLTEEQHAALMRIHKKTGQTITAIIRNYVIVGLENEAKKESMKSRERIGDGLVRLGKMTREQAEDAYQVQKEKYNFTKRFGEIAVELMFINRETLDEYLGDA